MFEDWKEQRKAIKKHILKIYDGTNSQNKAELDRFLEFVIGNYDLDDELYTQVKEDIEFEEQDDEMSDYDFESLEYEYNVLRGRRIC